MSPAPVKTQPTSSDVAIDSGLPQPAREDARRTRLLVRLIAGVALLAAATAAVVVIFASGGSDSPATSVTDAPIDVAAPAAPYSAPGNAVVSAQEASPALERYAEAVADTVACLEANDFIVMGPAPSVSSHQYTYVHTYVGPLEPSSIEVATLSQTCHFQHERQALADFLVNATDDDRAVLASQRDEIIACLSGLGVTVGQPSATTEEEATALAEATGFGGQSEEVGQVLAAARTDAQLDGALIEAAYGPDGKTVELEASQRCRVPAASAAG